MNEQGATTLEGPLGSTIHVLHADPETVVALAGIDWNRCFRRVCLDPVRGVITLMSPSRKHEDLSVILHDALSAAGSLLAGTVRGLRSPRLRGPGDPPGTGMEPDCAFYFGENARGYLAAFAEGDDAADAFLERTAPDLVVEVEITHADESKIERYATLGVREMWRLHGRKGARALKVDLLDLNSGPAPRRLAASQVLPELTPDDVCEAVEKVGLSGNLDEMRETVARIVRRRQRASVRVREEAPPYRNTRHRSQSPAATG